MAGEKKRLDGRIVTMDPKSTVLQKGSIFIEGTDIVAVQAASAAPPAGFETVAAIETGGTIFPGLIDLHNHLSYNALRLWNVPQKFTNRAQWPNRPEYHQLVTGPMSVLGHSKDPKILPSIVRYVEAKCLVAGVTTSQGIALAAASGIEHYYKGLVRNVESPGDKRLPSATSHIADVVASDWKKFDAEIEKPKRLLLHLAEGKEDSPAHAHFLALKSGSSWAISPSLVGIHCAALQKADFATLAEHGGSMVWSPLSNYLLYGATADVAAAKAAKVKIALGPDWSPTGSKSLLGELKAAHVASKMLGNVFSDEEIVRMATSVAAEILNWTKNAGSIEAGKLADLVVISRPVTAGKEYAALIAAHETDVALVIIGGTARYGTPALMKKAGSATGESFKVGGQARSAFWDDPNGDPNIDKIDLGEATSTLKAALANLPNLKVAHDKAVAEAAPPPNVRLALDEQETHGFALRPHLPVGGAPTGLVETERTAAVPAKLVALKLDPLTVVDDPDFVPTLDGELNLPDALKTGLKAVLGK